MNDELGRFRVILCQAWRQFARAPVCQRASFASMESLEANCLGYAVKSGSTVAFLKELPSKVEDASITKHGVLKDDYKKSFFKLNMDISNKLRDRIKANNEFACVILNATEEDDSEQSSEL